MNDSRSNSGDRGRAVPDPVESPQFEHGPDGQRPVLQTTDRHGAVRRDWVVICVCVLAVGAWGWWMFRAGPRRVDVVRPEPQRVSRDEFVEVGGIRRPASDVMRSEPLVADRKEVPTEQDYGKFPLIPKDVNVHVKSVAEAIRTGTHPERLSSLVLPKPFDAAVYAANPDAYLNVVEPGRVWQPAQPAPNVPRLAPLTALHFTVEQGQPTTMRVQSVAGAPVTFSTFDGGAFDNQLTSITVRANDKGVAQARFTGTTGVIHDVNILAASPMNSGQLKYIANVTLPKKSPLASAKTK